MTNANKLFGLLTLSLLSVSSLSAQAADPVVSAPALYGVGEIQVQQARLADHDLTATCGLSPGEVSHLALKALKNDQLPAFSVVSAPAPKENMMRIDMLPTLATIQVTDTSCTSWIHFSAQTRAPIEIAPIKTPRNLVLTHWEAGMLVHSNKTGHPQAIVNAMDKLVGQFGRQYRLDQPPELKAPEPAQKP